MKNKILFIFLGMTFLYIAVAAKAFYVQVVNKNKLMAYSDSQILRKTKIYPKRGFILDRNENPLAINVQRFNLFTFVKNKKKLKKELKELKKIIPNLNYTKILKRIEKRKKFTWIAREVSLKPKQVAQIKKFKNITLESRSSRFYPNNELLAQTLGFVGIDNDGLAGIEYEFNDELKGQPVIHKYYKDAKGRPIKNKSADIHKRTADIVLSIDKDIQASLEENLKAGVEKHKALRGGAAVMDAETGEILAIGNYPTFDPNNRKNRKNRKLAFITDPFEPGSVFKSLTIASALENNVVTEDTNYFCERGKFRVGNHYITESDSDHEFEWLSVKDILKYSSNIGTTKIAFDLTYPTLKKTLDSMGIGKKTGVEIPGESRGIIDKDENVKPLRLSNVSFGQGVATTGIQMLAAYASIANGGYAVKPTILKIEDKKKIKKEKILSKSTANALTRMMIAAVEDGTGKNARVKHFTIAGKTSTAQRVDSAGGYKGYIAGFIGYPVNVDKRFVIFVYVDNPTEKGYYGNQVAAPIFQKIAQGILYKNKSLNTLAKFKNHDKTNLDNISIKYSARRKISKGVVPNLLGLDKGSALEILDSLKAGYKHRGFGIVKKQSPAAGTPLGKNTIVKLYFEAPKYE